MKKERYILIFKFIIIYKMYILYIYCSYCFFFIYFKNKKIRLD